MDLKSLIAKMDQIESKKILTESEKKETSWTDMKGKKHTATQVKGKSYGNQPEPKEVDSEGKPKSKKVKEGLGIADSLLESFGLQESDWQKDVTIDGMSGDGEFKFSPEQEKWLGGADRQDPFILARMPGPKPPISYFKDPAVQAEVKARFAKVFPATPTAVQPAATGNTDPTAGKVDYSLGGQKPQSGIKAPAVPAAAPAPAAAAPAAKPAIDPKKIERFKALLDKAAKAGA